MFRYKVIEIREGTIGGKMPGDKLQILNGRDREGLAVKAITSTEVKGRVRPGGLRGNSPHSSRRGAAGHPVRQW